MNEFIRQNRRLLNFYCIVAAILGWLLIAGGTFWFYLSISSVDIYNSDRPDILLHLISSLVFDFFVPGLIALGVMKFIRYLEDTSKPAHFLRNADCLFYMYAVFLVVKTYIRYFWYSAWYAELIIQSEASRLIFIQPFLLPTVAKVLILVGLGQILRRLIPVIEESKTLV